MTNTANSGVKAMQLVLPEKPNEATNNIARLFARQVSQRCDAKVTQSDHTPLKVELSLRAGIGPEGFTISDDAKRTVRITGNDELGLLYGIGKFLRTSRYDRDGFTPGTWRGTSAPQGSFRAIYAATHFGNFYEAAPAEEVQRYIEELALWGANALIVHFPTWSFNGFEDPAASKSLDRTRQLLTAAKNIGMNTGLVQCPNQGFATAPLEIRAAEFPDDLHRRGSFGINCCPSRPEGREYLISLYTQLFDYYADIALDYLVLWPYDEGGCGCTECWPWGASGFPRISREVFHIAREKFPSCQRILSTWVYDTPPAGEWEGLAEFLKRDKEWVDCILADSHTDFPRYPLEKGVPGGLPLVNFPEISMWGRDPWGGYGANPLPTRFQELWQQTTGRVSGGMPYSEGLYEDINKALCLQFYWQHDRTAEETLKEYLAFEYSPNAVGELLDVVHLLEETWLSTGPKSLRAHELIRKAESELTAQARSGWRWRVLYLRTIIDSEMSWRNGKMEGVDAFAELTGIYHAENALPNVRPLRVASEGKDTRGRTTFCR